VRTAVFIFWSIWNRKSRAEKMENQCLNTKSLECNDHTEQDIMASGTCSHMNQFVKSKKSQRVYIIFLTYACYGIKVWIIFHNAIVNFNLFASWSYLAFLVYMEDIVIKYNCKQITNDFRCSTYNLHLAVTLNSLKSYLFLKEHVILEIIVLENINWAIWVNAILSYLIQ